MTHCDVCEKIKELRSKHGFTQVELANMLGVSKSVLSAYENAVHLPPYDILIKLSSIFHVSCDYLLGIENHPTIDAISNRLCKIDCCRNSQNE